LHLAYPIDKNMGLDQWYISPRQPHTLNMQTFTLEKRQGSNEKWLTDRLDH